MAPTPTGGPPARRPRPSSASPPCATPPEQVEAAAEALGDPGLRRARHVVTENARVLEAVALLRAGDLDRLGPLLAASHASLRDDYEVSSPELDTAVAAAVDAGAVGARMTGAGFGGSAIALVRAGEAGRVAERAAEAFAAAGFGARGDRRRPLRRRPPRPDRPARPGRSEFVDRRPKAGSKPWEPARRPARPRW